MKTPCIAYIIVAVTLGGVFGCVQPVPPPVPSGTPYYAEVTDVRGYQGLVLIPENKSLAHDGKLPTILFLHGIGESGNELARLRRGGFPRDLEGDKSFPFIFIMPQCPETTEWYYTNVDNVSFMRQFLDDMVQKYPIDTNRIYLTGLSMGGIGAWYFAIKMPERFAALAPVAFRGDGWSPCPAKHLPVWGFHGALDNIIPLWKAEALVDEFQACGGNMRFTVYPEADHDSWTASYRNDSLYIWMLTHSRD